MAVQFCQKTKEQFKPGESLKIRQNCLSSSRTEYQHKPKWLLISLAEPSVQSSRSLHGRPLVSVIIDNYNYGRYLKQAIDSVLSQAYQNIEVVVVDDGSTDDSPTILAEYGGRIKAVLKSNGGQSSALNAGFANSSGQIICLLDSDDWFFAEKVERVVEYFEANATVEWVFDPVELVFPDGSKIVRPRHSGDIFVDARELAPRGKLGPVAPAHSGLSFRRELLGKFLPMTEDIRMGSDNYLKFASHSFAPGIQLHTPLTAQRIHDSNAGTMRTDKLVLRAVTHLLIARELKLQFPTLSRLSNKIFAKAAADYVRGLKRDPVGEEALISFLKQCSVADIIDVFPRTTYQVFRRWGSTGE